MAEEKKQNDIHAKGFDISEYANKIKIGTKTLTDATIDLGVLRYGDKIYADKRRILRALANRDINELRAISNYFYRTSGIYQAVCNYYANMYRWDWYITPEIYDEQTKEEKILTDFTKMLNYLDNSYIQKLCGDIALKVVINGCYYGYIIEGEESIIIQELPIRYCRTRFSVNNEPVIEFDMSFFDTAFPEVNYRMKILKMFPAEFQKGYILYKQGKLPIDVPDDLVLKKGGRWYVLEPGRAIKFNLQNGDFPIFVPAIPPILDLDAAQDLDRRKQLQQLLKIIVQKLPRDKNGDLIFDIDEARDIHNNAVQMLQRAVGVDVLTTFADVEAIDLSDTVTSSNTDALERVERTVYNSLGISKNIFNTDGNLSLEKSILEDAGAMRTLLLQFRTFFDKIVQRKHKGNKKKYNFRLYMLETTQYNYMELSDKYKSQVQVGYSKMLPQIALGHSQSSIINTAYFENNVLHLSEIMIPPMQSSVMNAESITTLAGSNKEHGKSATDPSEPLDDEGKVGRPEKSDSEKSDKTIANLESQG